MLSLKMIALLTIAGSSLVAGSSIAYYYGYALPKKDREIISLQKVKLSVTPTPSPTATPVPTASPSATSIPTIIPRPTTPQWTFKNTQYEVTLSNFTYPQNIRTCKDDDNICKLEQKVEAGQAEFQIDLTLKNVSITPFITNFMLSDCSANKMGFNAGFITVNPLQKGLLSGETITVHLAGSFYSNAYDVSGNKIKPPSDLKVTSCKISPSTINNATIEPKTIYFNP